MKISVLIISYRSISKLKKCIESIGTKKEILIIENSNLQKIKNIIEDEYLNCKVIINNSNLGYASAANIGFNYLRNKYVLLLNTDVIINEDQINLMEKEITDSKLDFTLASPLSDDLIDFNKNNNLDKSLNNYLDDFDKEKKNN